MSSSSLTVFTAEQWREHAEDALNVAAGMRDDNMRVVMLDIAVRYEKLAVWAEAREAREEGNAKGP